MISAIYIASACNRLDLELKIIRHFLLHPQSKEARDAFVATEMAERTRDMEGYLARKPDSDWLDEFIAPSILKGQKSWLESNLHHLKEISENRLNQMELILRYTLFEGFIQKIAGNVLWEYPELRRKSIHEQLQGKSGHKRCLDYHQRRLNQHPDGERIAWTIATVEAVDRLPFDQWKEETAPVYLWTYLRDAFDLSFPQPELWPTLERLRRIRNHIVHRSLELRVSNDRMSDARVFLGNFATLVCQNAGKSFPKACNEGRPEEGEDGTPAYLILQNYY